MRAAVELGRRAVERGAGGLADASRVARFLRGAAQFRVRPGDVFISSYPRSGTTWLQHLAHVLSTHGDVSFAHIADVVPWYERSLSLGRLRASDFESMTGPRLFKSHLPYGWLPRHARYIYVRRDGRDVAVSYYHFYRSHLGFEGDFDDFFERFMSGRLQYGSWFKHVAGWERLAGHPAVLILDYEDLLRDLPSALGRVAAHCGHGLDAAAVDALLPLCGFDFMKENEARYDHATEAEGQRSAPTRDFIRRGRAGAHVEFFDADKRRRFAERLARGEPMPGVELRLAAFLL